ncbi:hypothetical protein [Nocardiopsis dassonvillei]|uniref:hypothetical protein n=1 Tax=Nocardiopsis dassonvillei TaxID=2014 RepID=UPI00366E5553
MSGIAFLVLWLLFLLLVLVMPDSRSDTLLYGGLGLLAAVVLTVLTAEFGNWETRTLIRDDPLPADADPIRVAVAEQLVASGVLGPDPETNRLARILADQEARKLEVRHPRAWQAFLVATSVGVAVMTTRTLMVEGLTSATVPEVAIHSLIAVFCLWAAWRHPAHAAERRHRTEALSQAYDPHASGERHT